MFRKGFVHSCHSSFVTSFRIQIDALKFIGYDFLLSLQLKAFSAKVYLPSNEVGGENEWKPARGKKGKISSFDSISLALNCKDLENSQFSS